MSYTHTVPTKVRQLLTIFYNFLFAFSHFTETIKLCSVRWCIIIKYWTANDDTKHSSILNWTMKNKINSFKTATTNQIQIKFNLIACLASCLHAKCLASSVNNKTKHKPNQPHNKYIIYTNDDDFRFRVIFVHMQ